jgi:hypothetical protein
MLLEITWERADNGWAHISICQSYSVLTRCSDGVKFPLSMMLMCGSQADRPERNKITILKVSDIHKTQVKEGVYRHAIPMPMLMVYHAILCVCQIPMARAMTTTTRTRTRSSST